MNMNKRKKPSKKRKGGGIGLLVCFAAAAIMAGTYAFQGYRNVSRQADPDTEKELTAEADEEKEEAGSPLVFSTQEEARDEEETLAEGAEEEQTEESEESQEQDSSQDTWAAPAAGGAQNLNFSADSILLWPVEGPVLMNYSMDKTVYFSTLDQYKYNPALIISGAEGDQVICGSAGIVKSIDENAQTGTTVNIDLGNGYELFYGQLKDVTVSTGDYVEAKTVLGYVAEPTKYYTVEGSNVYFEMRKDGQPIDPLEYMEE